MVTAASLNVDLTASIGSFESSMKRAGSVLQSFSSMSSKLETAFTAAGLAIRGGLFLMVKQFADAGSEVADLSKVTGVSAEALSALGYAGKLSGVSLDTIGGALSKMNKALATAPQKFKDLGLNIDTLRQLNTEQQFIAIADAIAAIPDQATKTALAMGIFGKSASALFPLIDGGKDSLEALATEARELGAVITNDAAAKADKLGDSMDKVTIATGALSKAIGESLAPVYTDFNEALAEIIGLTTKFVKENDQLAKGALSLGTALGVVATALWGLRLAMIAIISTGKTSAAVFGVLRTAALVLATAFGVLKAATMILATIGFEAIGAWLFGGTGGLAAAFAAVTVGLKALGAAFVAVVASPAALVAAVAALVAGLLAFTETGQNVISWIYNKLGAAFTWLYDKIKSVIGASGEMGQAVGQVAGIQPPAFQGNLAEENKLASGFDQLWKSLSASIPDRFARALDVARAKEKDKSQNRQRPDVSNLLNLPGALMKQAQAVANVGGQSLFTVLAENIKKFNQQTSDITTPNTQGPALIQAGSAEAFNLGRNSQQQKTDDKIEENTKQTYKQIMALASTISSGLKVNITNIEAFAP